MTKCLSGQTAFTRKVENQLFVGEQILCTATPSDNRARHIPHASFALVLVFFCFAGAPFFHPVAKFISLLVANLMLVLPVFLINSKPAFIAICTNKRILFCDSTGLITRSHFSHEVRIQRKGEGQLTVAEKSGEYTTTWLLNANPKDLELFDMRRSVQV